jgi:23S rRNA (cytidine1920-2'-O)/16S rRNA (cytidine1409-2'-O)-methyltransferase
MSEGPAYVSRGGTKLAAALDAFGIDPTGLICADLGSNVGGFTDCLLQRGAARVYAVDTGYGVLAWKLRRDERVVVLERTNAMHVTLPEPVALVTIDVGWTPQHHILPNAIRLLGHPPTVASLNREPGSGGPGPLGGSIITLIKPHYEAERSQLADGVLDPQTARADLQAIRERVAATGVEIKGLIESPLPGRKGNLEFLAWLTRR